MSVIVSVFEETAIFFGVHFAACEGLVKVKRYSVAKAQ